MGHVSFKELTHVVILSCVSGGDAQALVGIQTWRQLLENSATLSHIDDNSAALSHDRVDRTQTTWLWSPSVWGVACFRLSPMSIQNEQRQKISWFKEQNWTSAPLWWNQMMNVLPNSHHPALSLQKIGLTPDSKCSYYILHTVSE